MKKLNKKKIVLIIIAIAIITSIIIFIVKRNFYREGAFVAPLPNIENISRDDQIVKCENKIEGIEIGKIETTKQSKENHITIEISNTTEEDKFNLPISIEFINLDGDSIFKTGYVQDVFRKDMTVDINAKITSQIAEMIKKKQIDHIEINMGS